MARSYEELESALKAAGMSNPVMLAVARTNPDAIEALLPSVAQAVTVLAREAVEPAFKSLVAARNEFSTSLSNVAEDLKAGRTIGDTQVTSLGNALTEMTGKFRAFSSAVGGKKAAVGGTAGGTKRAPSEIVAGLDAKGLAERDEKLIKNDLRTLILKDQDADDQATVYAKLPKDVEHNLFAVAAWLGIAVPSKHQGTYERLMLENAALNKSVALAQAARKAAKAAA